jgi:hypothetical protein
MPPSLAVERKLGLPTLPNSSPQAIILTPVCRFVKNFIRFFDNAFGDATLPARFAFA